MARKASETVNLDILNEELKEVSELLVELSDEKTSGALSAKEREDKIDGARTQLEAARTTIALIKSAPTKQTYNTKYQDLTARLNRLALIGGSVHERKALAMARTDEDASAEAKEGYDKLKDALDVLHQTEVVGRDTTRRLREQHETEKRINQNLKAMQPQLSAANRDITRMQRREAPFSFLSGSKS